MKEVTTMPRFLIRLMAALKPDPSDPPADNPTRKAVDDAFYFPIPF